MKEKKNREREKEIKNIQQPFRHCSLFYHAFTWGHYQLVVIFSVSLQVISIVMDVFTDVDIFKEVVNASLRGTPVYILLDGFHVKSFLAMAENQGVNIRELRVSAG